MTKMEVIRENLADMLGIEQHVLQTIERQTRDDRVKKFYNAYEPLKRIESVLRSNTAELERHLSTVDDGLESKLKKAATSIAGSVAVFMTDSVPMSPFQGVFGTFILHSTMRPSATQCSKLLRWPWMKLKSQPWPKCTDRHHPFDSGVE